MYLAKFQGQYLPTTCLVGDELVIGLRGERYWYSRPSHQIIGLSVSLFMQTPDGGHTRVFQLYISNLADPVQCIRSQYGAEAVGTGLVDWEEVPGVWRNTILGRRKYRAIAIKS